MLTQTKLLVGSTSVLYAKYLVTLGIQGSKRFAAGTRPPEDKILKSFNPTNTTQSFGLQTGAASSNAVEQDIRWNRIVQNDLENIPMGLLVAWAAIHSGGNEFVNCAAIGTFTAARVYHTYAYANALQPHRGNAWTIGSICVLALALNGVYGITLADAKPATEKC